MAQTGSLCQFQQPMSGFTSTQAGSAEDGLPASEEDSPLFHSDDFRIWCMKVIPCTKRFVHDWTICPFAHAGEKAVRRDPRTHNYTGIACPDMKKQSSCIRGDKCPYAHNVFEYWLHPTRYRTQLCNDGPTCKRSICFFAHSLEELRVPAVKPYVSPEALARASLEAIQQNPHPLGQQLPNPAAAMHAAAAAAAPAGHHHHQQQARGMGNTMAQQQSYNPHLSRPSPTYGGYPIQQQRSAPAAFAAFPGTTPAYGQQTQAPPSPYAPRAASVDGRRASFEGMKLSLTPQVPQWGGDPMCFPQSPALSPQWTPEFSVGSLPGTMGPANHYPVPAPNSYPTPNACRASFDAGSTGFGAPTMLQSSGSAGCLSNGSLGSVATAGMSGGSAGGTMGGLGSAESLPGLDKVVQRSSDSDLGSRAVSPVAADGVLTSGTIPPASELDLAQSLATLKIALTQQHVAAAAGSNHEIVISTLHQILKDAIAQHGGKMPQLALPTQQSISPPGSAGGSSAVGSPSLSSLCAPTVGTDQTGAQAPGRRGQQAQQQQQPWINTMGPIKWDAPPSTAPATPSSPISIAGPQVERRVSGESVTASDE